MFTTDFKVRCITEIECSIELPGSCYFVRNQNSMRLCYSLDSQLRYINLASRLEAVELLLKIKPEVIDGYTIDADGQLHMYTNTLFTVYNHKGVPVQYTKQTPVKWESINLSPIQVQAIAALHEWEQTGGTMGNVVSMATHYLNKTIMGRAA